MINSTRTETKKVTILAFIRVSKGMAAKTERKQQIFKA